MTCCVVLNHHFDVKFSLPWSLCHVICNLPSVSVCACYDEAVWFCLLVFLNCKKLLPIPRIQKLWLLCSVVFSISPLDSHFSSDTVCFQPSWVSRSKGSSYCGGPAPNS